MSETVPQPETVPPLANEIAEAMKTGPRFCTLVAPAEKIKTTLNQLTENLEKEGSVVQVSIQEGQNKRDIFTKLAIKGGKRDKLEAILPEQAFNEYQEETLKSERRCFVILEGVDKVKKEAVPELWEFIRDNFKNDIKVQGNTSWLLTSSSKTTPIFERMPPEGARDRKHFEPDKKQEKTKKSWWKRIKNQK